MRPTSKPSLPTSAWSPTLRRSASAEPRRTRRTSRFKPWMGWRPDKTYAVVVPPLYQLSEHELARSMSRPLTAMCVCSRILTLAVLVGHRGSIEGPDIATELLGRVLARCSTMNPSRRVHANYWVAIDGELLSGPPVVRDLWRPKGRKRRGDRDCEEEALDVPFSRCERRS